MIRKTGIAVLFTMTSYSVTQRDVSIVRTHTRRDVFEFDTIVTTCPLHKGTYGIILQYIRFYCSLLTMAP